MTLPIIIDTDPGIDDAAAISLALNHPEIDVQMITTVSGNVGIESTTANALKLKSFFGSDVPVHRGASRPLINDVYDAKQVHGDSGMDGYDFPEVSLNDLSSNNAIEAMKHTIYNSKSPITLIALGPLTNIALLLSTYPETKDYLKEIILMGGSAGRGNVTPLAEFNIFCDPEAAHVVFNSGLPLTMIGLDLARQSRFSHDFANNLKNLNQTGHMLYHLFQNYKTEDIDQGLNLYDVFTILYLVAPDSYETLEAMVQVELDGKYTKGATVVDFNSKFPNCSVVLSSKDKSYNDQFMNILSYCK